MITVILPPNYHPDLKYQAIRHSVLPAEPAKDFNDWQSHIRAERQKPAPNSILDDPKWDIFKHFKNPLKNQP